VIRRRIEFSFCGATSGRRRPAGATPADPLPTIIKGKTRRMATTKKPPTTTLTYEDRPALQETFADNVQKMTFDGRTLRIEFCVARKDDPPAGHQVARSGKSVPVVRLILDLDGAVDLFNKINNLQAALENAGVIRKTPGVA
jgi:hypothetical protein